MRVLVAGATGVIGRPLVELLLADHEVVGLTRSKDSAARLEAAGASARVADVFDRDRVVALARELSPDAIVHQLTALPPNIRPRHIDEDMAATNRLRTDGTNVLAAAAEACGAHLVAQSIAFLYGPADTPRAEADPLVSPRVAGRMVAAIQHLESTVTAAGGAALRYGFFYGPGTIYAAGGGMRGAVAHRKVPIVGRGRGLFPFVHVTDAARATVLAVERKAIGIFNIVEPPVAVSEWLPRYAEAVGGRPPRSVPRWLARLGAGRYAVYLMDELPGADGSRAASELSFRPSRQWSDAPVLDSAPG